MEISISLKLGCGSGTNSPVIHISGSLKPISCLNIQYFVTAIFPPTYNIMGNKQLGHHSHPL